ncbi:MAG: hypothetical protein EB153_02500, partial [Nitrosopumilaceae archaeon]|nr:hypothetical protein [Nitrosopumilaceae archaeon]
DMFEGYDAYAVEINGVDGKSYDVFVSLDGEVLGYDAYEIDEQKSADIGLEAEMKIKRMYSQEERDEMAKEGIAMPDGSFPIADVDDLKNAVQAFGRAKDKKKARAHIMKRARALAEDGMIPDNWLDSVKKSFSSDGSDSEKALVDDEFLADLMEFQLLAEEENIDLALGQDQEEKRMYSEESRTEMADSGEAMPDGSYPIADEADLRNAIQAYGRAKDKEATKAHIIKRAEDLGLENLIPESWGDELPEEVTGEKSLDDFSASLEEFSTETKKLYRESIDSGNLSILDEEKTTLNGKEILIRNSLGQYNTGSQILNMKYRETVFKVDGTFYTITYANTADNFDNSLSKYNQVLDSLVLPESKSGGCLIATAAFGTELAPQVQLLRETRDNVLFSTGSGTAFMTGFNEFYYVFSPTISDWERQSPLFKETIRYTLTPMLWTLSILQFTDIDSESKLLGYGIGIILLNVGIYFIVPTGIILRLKKFIR